MIYLETKLHGNSGQSALVNILAAKQTGDILHGNKNRTCEKNRTNDDQVSWRIYASSGLYVLKASKACFVKRKLFCGL